MPLDEGWLNLRVESWSQTIIHDSAPRHTLHVRARTKQDEELELGTEGRLLTAVPVHLTILRAGQEKTPEHGIGRIQYHPATASSYDKPGTEEFIGGWFWLPEESYDEVWLQVRDISYQACVLDVEFAPVSTVGFSSRWHTWNTRPSFITSASIRFDRR